MWEAMGATMSEGIWGRGSLARGAGLQRAARAAVLHGPPPVARSAHPVGVREFVRV